MYMCCCFVLHIYLIFLYNKKFPNILRSRLSLLCFGYVLFHIAAWIPPSLYSFLFRILILSKNWSDRSQLRFLCVRFNFLGQVYRLAFVRFEKLWDFLFLIFSFLSFVFKTRSMSLSSIYMYSVEWSRWVCLRDCKWFFCKKPAHSSFLFKSWILGGLLVDKLAYFYRGWWPSDFVYGIDNLQLM